jgi:hypothetical protein
MKLKPKHKLVEHLGEIEDPRIERSQRHKLIDILAIAILAMICGADSWVGMEKVALTACMHKLLIILNAIVKSSTPWQLDLVEQA